VGGLLHCWKQSKAVGALISKALGSLKNGNGKIPTLVMLQ
jgi:hypothetical protein